MAAPAAKTLNNLDGQWVLNKSLSQNIDGLFAIQGMAWAVQKAIEVATITYIVTQTKTEEGVDHLSIEQGGIGGLNSTAETHILNRQPVTSSDYIFGEVESKSYWVKTAEVIEQSLRHGWEKDIEEGQCIKIDTKSLKNGWDSQQIYGFSEIEGKRHHARRFVVTKGKERVEALQVFDFKGEK